MTDATNIIPLPTPQTAQGGDPNVAGCTVSTDQMLQMPGVPEPGAGIEGIDDTEAFFNMRDWLQKACEAKGARKTGGGIGCGQADIDIELEGHHYNISIRPLRR